jgi:hypothetical protein
VVWNDDEVHFVLDQDAELDFYSASSLKQQSADRHVATLGHIILIPSQPVFALSPNYIYLTTLFIQYFLTASMVQWLACSLRVWYIVGSSPGRVKPKTMKLAFVASLLSTQH